MRAMSLALPKYIAKLPPAKASREGGSALFHEYAVLLGFANSTKKRRADEAPSPTSRTTSWPPSTFATILLPVCIVSAERISLVYKTLFPSPIATMFCEKVLPDFLESCDARVRSSFQCLGGREIPALEKRVLFQNITSGSAAKGKPYIPDEVL